MIKCHFVDVKSIHSTLPRSSFDESELEGIADAILLTNGLLRPIVLERTGTEEYKVIAGDREYYAAVIAKEKDIQKAEMVNAFVIDPQIRSAALNQLDLLTSSRSTPDIELLLTSISALLAQQLQPVLTQLDRHERVLSKLDPIPVIEPEIVKPEPAPAPPPTPVQIEDTRATEPKTPKAKTSKQTADSKPTAAKAAKARSSEPTAAISKTTKTRFPAGHASQTTEPKATTPKSPAQKQIKSAEIVPDSQTGKPKTTSNLLAEVDPIKAIKTLDLIDRLDEDMLLRRMKQSGIAKADKLVPNIIAKRELQPNGKFDSWQQIAAAKISGLGEATIVKIIDKLK